MALVDVGAAHGRSQWRAEGAGRILAVFVDSVTGRTIVTDGFCPHSGAPLHDAELDRGSIVCPWHGYRFSTDDGTCANNARYRLPVYQTVTEAGRTVAEVPFNPLGIAPDRRESEPQ